uniref:C2 domain-containing protein n=1 Tax=Acrobeloides nanus TaxID=290746 RepID=A0A914EB83_9BILA
MSECGFTIQGTNVVDVAQELSVSPCVIFDDIPKEEAHEQEKDSYELHDIDFIVERVDFDENVVGKSTSEPENEDKSALENCTFHEKQEIELGMLTTPESCQNEAQEDSKAVSVTTDEGLASKILEEDELVTPKKFIEEDETKTLSSSETSKDITYETQAMTDIFKDNHPSPPSKQDHEHFHEAQDLPTPISSTQPKHDHTSSHSIPPQISITDSIDDTFQQLALEELEPISISSTSTSPASSDLPKNGNKQSDSTSSSRTSLTSSTSTSQQVALGLLSTALANRLGSAPLPRIVEWLRINIVQLKMVNKCDGQAKLSVQVKFDNQDVFQTAMVPCTSSCVFGDEFTQEFKPNITSLRLYVTEQIPNQKSRLIGRALIRRKEAVQAASQDNWYTVYGVSGTKSAVSTGIGEICLDTTYDAASKIMKLRILDFTVPPHAADQLRSSNGQAYLGFRVAGHGEFTSMEKLKISSERRSLQTVQLDCSGFAERLKEARARQLSVDSVTSDCTTQSVHSLTLTPGTPCSIRRPTPTSSSGSTSTLFDDSPLRLSIKVYKDPKNESSCCGHVRIPLDDETMLPKGKPTGPNWWVL